MKTIGRTKWVFAVSMTAMIMIPVIPILGEDTRATDIIEHISTFADGSSEKTITFSTPGTDKSLSLRVPNGAKIRSATINLTTIPLTPGSANYVENLTFDIGNDGVYEWAFNGKGYGRLGEQFLLSNPTNSSEYFTIPFYAGGSNDTIRIRLPKDAHVNKAILNLEGTGGTGPSTINTVTQRQAWSPNGNVQQGASMMMDELNGNILYDLVQFDLSTIPNTVFVCNATLWWGRNGLGNYEQMGGYSFFDPLGAYQVLEQWSIPTSKILIETSPPESTNMMEPKTVYVPWTITKMMGSWVEKQRPNYGLCIHRTQLADRDKWDYMIQTPYITLQYGNAANVSLAVKGVSPDLFNMPGPFTTLVNVPDFSAVLNSYLLNATPSKTDEFGTEFVDVPLSLATTDPGRLNISALDVSYDFSVTLDTYPNESTLADALDALVSTKVDGKFSNIVIAISSTHSGKLKVSGISIDYAPPDHYASITTWTPEDPIVMMKENSTIELSITAEDMYNYPLNVTWKLNNAVIRNDEYNMTWYADFEANDTYNISVFVNNLLHDTIHSWRVIVENVNRNPIIEAFSPAKKFEMDENSSASFGVTASDPDNDVLSYSWYTDGRLVTGEDSFFEYRTNYYSAGKHEVKVVVWDAASASTVMAWNVTVNNVNAAPEITDSSPPIDEIPMNENSAKKFSVTDLAIDGDKHLILWYVDGNSTGATGKTYEYSASFDSAGRHEVAAEVSDGKLTARRTWYVTVADVNRPPVAVISGPAAGAEFMVGERIQLDGTQSSDPDGDQLTMTWTDGPTMLGTGATLAVNLSKGKHSITLRIDDGRKNGTASGTLQITVKYLDFSGKLTLDTGTPVEGKNIKLTALLSNRGDGSIDELPVSFCVDGKEVSTTTIESVGPDTNFPLEFQWNAVMGDHELEVSVNDQNFSKLVTVAKKPASAVPAGDLLMPLIAIAIVAVVAAGVAVFAIRRKRTAPKIPLKQQSRKTTQAAIPYEPTLEVPAATGTESIPAAVPVATPSAPSEYTEAGAHEALKNAEEMIQQSENAGLDVSKARQTLKIAQNFFDMGKFQKAITYCQTAENSIE